MGFDFISGMPEDASVKMARNRFKNVLRHMSLQDSYMQDDESDSDTDEGLLLYLLNLSYSAPVNPFYLTATSFNWCNHLLLVIVFLKR